MSRRANRMAEQAASVALAAAIGLLLAAAMVAGLSDPRGDVPAPTTTHKAAP